MSEQQSGLIGISKEIPGKQKAKRKYEPVMGLFELYANTRNPADCFFDLGIVLSKLATIKKLYKNS